jgi:uncharacterized membrane protein
MLRTLWARVMAFLAVVVVFLFMLLKISVRKRKEAEHEIEIHEKAKEIERDQNKKTSEIINHEKNRIEKRSKKPVSRSAADLNGL